MLLTVLGVWNTPLMNRTPFPTPIPEAVLAPPTVSEYVLPIPVTVSYTHLTLPTNREV